MKPTLDEILRQAAEDAEESRDLGPSPHAAVLSEQAKEPTAVYSLRIPISKIERLRTMAAALGTSPSALLREWALERLAESEENAARDHLAATAQRLRDVADELERAAAPTRESA